MSITRKWALKQQRAGEILVLLKRLYPDATCSLNYETPVQLLVATILSAQCTDERVYSERLKTRLLWERMGGKQAIAYGKQAIATGKQAIATGKQAITPWKQTTEFPARIVAGGLHGKK